MIPLVETYLEMIKCDKSTKKVMNGYMDLIKARATGKLLTTAQWLRKVFLSCSASSESGASSASSSFPSALMNATSH
jgi:hypothetical protein